ncbi:MAG: hypothetical protein QNJ22_02500 [Desulfosarcinaceae bacterium]|nr:hypothetical protein [Desulfosarcinaceae bacterium]
MSDLMVSSAATNTVLRYDMTTGAYVEIFLSSDDLRQPHGVFWGPDDDIYVAGKGSHNILRFDGETGVFIDAFVKPGSGGLNAPTGLTFGPDGHLYVASSGTDEILRYDGHSGDFIDVFTAEKIAQPRGITLGPDGHFYIASGDQDQVVKLDGSTGNKLGALDAFGILEEPSGLVLGPDANLYVAGRKSNNVVRFDGQTGAFIDEIVPAASGGLDQPTDLFFGLLDQQLYVASSGTNSLLRFDGETGDFIDVFVSAGSGGLDTPTFFTFGPLDLVPTFSATEDTVKTAPVFGDFNGDGFDDLAIGCRDQKIPNQFGTGEVPGGGAVGVVYGGPIGLSEVNGPGTQLWHLNTPNLSRVPGEEDDHFGHALAVGDFNDDGFVDLAMGAPDKDRRRGLVTVIFGSPDGLSSPGTQFTLGDTGGFAGSGDRFGFALAAGYFDADTFADLAVGAPGNDVFGTITGGGLWSSNVEHGSVGVFYGGPDGLDRDGGQVWSQRTPDIRGKAEDDDRFGAVLTTGNWGPFFDFLAIGVPGEDTGFWHEADAGAVNVLYGSRIGLTDTGNQLWQQDSDGIGEANDRDDEFGSAMAAGDFDGNGRDDLAIGVPSEDYGYFGRVDRGKVHVIYSDGTRLTAAKDDVWGEESLENTNIALDGDKFGRALAAGDFNGNGFEDLAIGVPGNVGGLVGTVSILFGGEDGLTGDDNQFFNQGTLQIVGEDEPGDSFGHSLATGDAGDPNGRGRGYADLAIGVNDGPYGGVNVIYGGPDGLVLNGNQQWLCDNDGLRGIYERRIVKPPFPINVDDRISIIDDDQNKIVVDDRPSGVVVGPFPGTIVDRLPGTVAGQAGGRVDLPLFQLGW